MFKKIEVWILYLVTFLNLILVVSFGVLVRQELVGSTKFGKLSKGALFLSEIPVNLKKFVVNSKKNERQTKEERFPFFKGFKGIPNSVESYLLLSRFNGDIKEGVVELVDLKTFEILHTWNPDINKFNKSIEKIDEFLNLERDNNDSRELLLHPKLTDEGGLLFANFSPLRNINACSDLIFQNSKDKFHHSIETDLEGNIWVPAHTYPQTLPIEKVGRGEIHSGRGYRDDSIVKLSQDGEILYEKSVSQIFIDNGLEYLLFSTASKYFKWDPIHLNDIQPVDFDSEFWKKGDVFLSLRHQSMVLLYRPSTNKIIWKGTGPFFHQHDVNILNDHQISIFNNNSKNYVSGDVTDKNAEVIIYDFKTNKYSSYLKESLIENDIRTTTQGRSKILANGDLFIEEQNYGRLVFFDSNGRLKWSYVNFADDEKTYQLGWSRILSDPKDINNVNKFLKSRGQCND